MTFLLALEMKVSEKKALSEPLPSALYKQDQQEASPSRPARSTLPTDSEVTWWAFV